MEKRVIDVIQKDVCKFFSIDEESMFMLKVEHGIQYLERRFQHDTDIMEKLKTSATWWTWWTQLWAERDRKLLTMVAHCGSWFLYTYPVGREVKLSNNDSYVRTESISVPLRDAYEFYKKHHAPERIQFYPNYVLINQCLSPQENNGDNSTALMEVEK